MATEDYPEAVQRVLRVVWINEAPCRYRPRSIGEGPAWDVWDYKLDRRVDPSEMATMSYEQVTEQLVN